MAENDNSGEVLNVLLAEFNALRSEIADRSSAAFTLLNINITATAVVAGFVLSDKADIKLLLILPLLSPALGMLFVDHSLNIKNLGGYINTQLRPMVAEVAGDGRILGYEGFVAGYEKNKFFRFMPLGFPLLLLFAGFPCAALLFVFEGLKDCWGWILWFSGLLMLLIFITLWTDFIIAPYRKHNDGQRS